MCRCIYSCMCIDHANGNSCVAESLPPPPPQRAFAFILCRNNDELNHYSATTRVDPRTVRVEIFLIAVDPQINIGIQMNRKELLRHL